VSQNLSSGLCTAGGLAVIRRTRPDVDPLQPSVLFVHGAMDRGASFSRVMRRLPEFDLIALDRRGYASSLGAGVCPTLEGHVDDIVEVLDFCGTSSVVVIGHSLGGTFALGLASRHDPRVRGIGVFESPVPSLDGSYAAVGGGAIELGEKEGAEAAAEYFYRLMVGEGTWNRLRERDQLARRAEGAALMAELRSLRTPGATVDPSQVALPVMMGMGTQTSTTMRAGSELLQAALPESELFQIAGAGHGAHLSHADEFARYTRSCVKFALPQSAVDR